MLHNEQYLGHLVALKTETIYKIHRTIHRPQEDWVVIKDVWPALVDQQTWETAQEKMQARHRPKKDGIVALFAGLIRCADCGHMMVSKGKRHAGFDDRYYRCGKYNAYGPEFCTPHSIWESQLHDVVLEDIRVFAQAALSNEKTVLTALLQRNDRLGRLQKQAWRRR